MASTMSERESQMVEKIVAESSLADSPPSPDLEKVKPLDYKASDHSPEYPIGLKRTLIVITVTLAYFLWMLDLAVISTATPAITSRFRSLADVGWYGAAYQLGSSAFQPLSGKIFQHFSTKWSFLAFLIIFELGSLLCGAATSSSMFIVGRAIAGVGSAGIANGSLTIISCIMPPLEQAKFMGINMGLGQLGVALGPIIGGLFTEHVSWRWCFYINLPVGAPVALIILSSRIPEAVPKSPALEILGTAIKSLDLMGFMLISPAAVMFLLGLQYGGNEYAWGSSVVIGLLVGALVTFGLFLAWERHRGDEAMVPFAMLKHRVIWSAATANFFVMGSILVADFYLAIYFQGVRDDSPFMSGVHMLPLTLSMVIFTMTAGVMTEILGYYLPWILGGSVVASIGYGLMSRLNPTTSVASWVGYQILYGVGGGSMSAASMIAVQNLVPAPQIPVAMAILILTQNMGGAVSLVAANAIFSNSLRSELNEHATAIGITPDVVFNAGPTAVHDLASEESLRTLLHAYSHSVDSVMYLGIAVSVGVFIFAWGLGWKDIRAQKKLQAIHSPRTDSKPAEASNLSP